MTASIFSIINNNNKEYDDMVIGFFNDPNNEYIPHERRMDMARRLGKEYLTLKAYESKMRLDMTKFNEGYE